jgi:aryl-alcohol dehydrogenase-like predicted oxidoreductase
MPVLGFGAVTLGREISEDASYELLDHAYELGFRIFDTAEAYGGGNSRANRLKTLGADDVREASLMMHSSEILLGRWVASRGIRSSIEIHTKVSGDFTAAGIHSALDRSLDRLQMDAVDGYYLHTAPAELAVAVSALASERESGRARGIGICNASVELLSAAHRIASLDLCQHIYNLAQPDPGRELIPWCRAQGIAFVAYSPLGAGFLTGKYGARGELSPKGTRFDLVPGHRDVYFRPECFEALDRLTDLAAESGFSAPHLALNWVLRQTDIAVVLIGATRPEHLDNAVSAMSSPVEDHVLAKLNARRVPERTQGLESRCET